MKDQAPTLLKKIRNKETMPTHWYSCKRIRHRMGTGVERLKEIDAANLKFIACFFVVHFFLSLNTVKQSAWRICTGPPRIGMGPGRAQDRTQARVWMAPPRDSNGLLGLSDLPRISEGTLSEGAFCQKRPSVHISVCSRFWKVCSQFRQSVRNSV